MDAHSLRVTVGVSGPTGTLFEQYRVAVDAGGPVLSDEAGLALEINGEQVVLRPPDAHPYDDALSIAPAYEERRFVLVHSSSRQDDARYVAAALRAVADVSGLPLVISITTDTDAIPAEAGGVFWLHEKAVPEAVSARVAEGLLLVSDAEGEGWQGVHRRVLLDTAAPATPPTLKRRVAALGRGHVEAVLITSDAQSATLARLADSLIAAPRYALPEARVAGFDVEIVPDAGRNTLLVGNRAPAGRALSLLVLVEASGDTLAVEPFGVSVEAPVPLRVLVLQGAPRFETRHLKNWLAEEGARLAIRSTISRDRYRTEFLNLPERDLSRLTPAVLRTFDVMILDGRVLAALSDTERRVLRTAVREEGLGVLLGPDLLIRNDGPSERFFQPFEGRPLDEAEQRRVRLTWGNTVLASSIPAEPYAIAPAWGVALLMQDEAGHGVAAMRLQGMGRVGLSLATETYRWVLEGTPGCTPPIGVVSSRRLRVRREGQTNGPSAHAVLSCATSR